ncbi:unnamed protein product [Symbiodinium natans]|uniref:Uncharacterized protein n=1 Tax=Symbiodinium natans TaxID=878477 RepID=A0A812P6M8_9DINO|nr:unnamed protein product [Symbiodinium natans]
MSAQLLDDAISEVNSQNFTLRPLCSANCSRIDPEQPLSINDFLDGACRPLNGIKSVAVVFDVHLGMLECGSSLSLGDLVAQKKFSDLPEELRFMGPLPAETNVDIVVCNLGDGLVDVMKVLYFKQSVSRQVAEGLCKGRSFAPQFRQGPWAVKKGIQWLMNQIPGFHVRWHSLDTPRPSLKRSQTQSSWNPENDELSAGIAFINKQAPVCDAANEQTFWILCNIKEDSGTPIAGWPETKVRFMAQNKSRGLGGALPKTEFPLTTYSLHAAMSTNILPYLYPLLMTTAVMFLGCAGVGKTPALIAMAMAMGRFHIRRLGLQGLQPGWRRAKSFDNFRHRAPQIQEALFLDDPSRGKIDMADLKSFVTVDEDGTVDSRYNDTRLTMNQMRALASNNTSTDPALQTPDATLLPPKDFMKLVEPLFRGDAEKDIMAVLKRSTTFVFTETALFLRLPSEKPDAIVHRIVADDLHLDLLAPRDKPFYGKYKSGVIALGDSFADDVRREQEMIDSSVAETQHFPSRDDYVNHANHAIQKWLTPEPKVRVIPSSPGSSNEADTSRSAFGLAPVFPVVGTGPKPGRLNSSSSFVYNDDKRRRLRCKTSVAEAGENQTKSPDEEDTLVANGGDSESANNQEQNILSSPGEAMDLDQGSDSAEEEAAQHLHG